MIATMLSQYEYVLICDKSNIRVSGSPQLLLVLMLVGIRILRLKFEISQTVLNKFLGITFFRANGYFEISCISNKILNLKLRVQVNLISSRTNINVSLNILRKFLSNRLLAADMKSNKTINSVHDISCIILNSADCSPLLADKSAIMFSYLLLESTTLSDLGAIKSDFFVHLQLETWFLIAIAHSYIED
ncbi:hypothetical protein PHYBLDRAFT_70836 [Phycomyces blakesleeanus NRRL 1555(-)]|uniref:Uncharacterized protein n=1 Tax=Phycomyces blakesleeanus (strain ATCC 8743b / DSM 1359 / FGSC 10004 / NBRC 33097 / NRRL 1555) TaxID=763407 RepID=A0A167JNN4_PHYB8|nr:hypothetical protein PHYBLDRAFT_70836 [Phycomyces blakesleeanus NRRL 1555(-)]OAD66376.1 hypothetical protein PHYBLDRAFT_70836 [Phycomyces blakesleeanus NRRL 1555(-)]|eukprot:XP_018284416.1 hypothetical protein PHYBLDRAFT_70836 [Phycomyces blakesleeanus NRRL 1555(-)]